jgi:hypothetical protein
MLLSDSIVRHCIIYEIIRRAANPAKIGAKAEGRRRACERPGTAETILSFATGEMGEGSHP